MNSERRVAVINGASQGVGAGPFEAFRERGYGVIATARSITTRNSPNCSRLAGWARYQRSLARPSIWSWRAS